MIFPFKSENFLCLLLICCYTFQESLLCLQNLMLQTASLTNERAQIMTEKNLSHDVSIWVYLEDFLLLQFSFILYSIRKVLCRKDFFLPTSVKPLLLPIHIQKHVNSTQSRWFISEAGCGAGSGSWAASLFYGVGIRAVIYVNLTLSLNAK